MALEITPDVLPPGRWTFTDTDEVTHESDTLPGLVKTLSEYRARLKQDAGNPLVEITEQVCSRSPRLCRHAPGTDADAVVSVTVPVPPAQPLTLAAQVVAKAGEWLNKLDDGTLTYVKPLEVDPRVGTCAVCPENVDYAKTCPPCQANVVHVLDEVAAHAQGVDDGPIAVLAGRACKRAGDDLSVSVLLGNHDEVPGAPAECWRAEGKLHKVTNVVGEPLPPVPEGAQINPAWVDAGPEADVVFPQEAAPVKNEHEGADEYGQ